MTETATVPNEVCTPGAIPGQRAAVSTLTVAPVREATAVCTVGTGLTTMVKAVRPTREASSWLVPAVTLDVPGP